MSLKGRLLLLLVSAGLTSCAQVEYKIEPEFIPYVDSFVKDGKELGARFSIRRLNVKMVSLPPNIAGRCWKRKRLIEVSQYYWQVFDENEKEVLLYHELGHCLLKREHDEGFIESPDIGYIEKSIMFPSVLNTWKYDFYRDYYVKELFTGKGEF